jgi:predicted choloylglycine hydrolase
LESDAIETTFDLACTAIGLCDSDVGPVVAKNCDERQSAAPFYVLQTIYPEDGLAFMGISNVGTIWLEGGMNETGFALMQTAGPIAPNQNGYGIACNIAPRAVLARSRTNQDSIAMLRDMYVAGWGMGLVLVDAVGSVATMEKTGDLCAVSSGEAGALFCTNHFVDPVMKDTRPVAHTGLEENSKARYETLQVLFEQKDWPHTLEGVKSALGYHGDAGFVCQHGNANLHSNYSCIALVREKKMLVGDGYPCQRNYTEYLL